MRLRLQRNLSRLSLERLETTVFTSVLFKTVAFIYFYFNLHMSRKIDF